MKSPLAAFDDDRLLRQARPRLSSQCRHAAQGVWAASVLPDATLTAHYPDGGSVELVWQKA